MDKRKLTKSAINNLHRFVSYKSNSVIEVETTLEYHTCFHLEYDPRVRHFEAQPVAFHFELEGKVRQCFPDFLATMSDGKQVYIENKMEDRTKSTSFKQAFLAKRKAAENLGIPLLLFNDNRINVPVIDNYKILHRYHESNPPKPERQWYLNLIKNKGKCVASQLVSESHHDTSSIFVQLLSMVANGYLSCDMKKPISTETMFYPKNYIMNSSIFSGQDDFINSHMEEAEKEAEEIQCYKDLSSYSEQEQDEALWRHLVIETLQNSGLQYFTVTRINDKKPLLLEKFGDKVPSSISIYRWWRAFENSGFELQSLVPKKSKGNSLSKLPAEIDALVDDAVKKLFDAEKPGFTSAYEYLEGQVDKHNEEHGTDFRCPSLVSIRKRYLKITPYEKLLLQKGKTAANKEFRDVKSKIKTNRVLERVEIDHTKLDLFVIDDNHGFPMGRPYLTLLIDSFSLCVVGFYLGFEPPSFMSVSNSLRNAILPKDYVAEEYPEIKNQWICQGIPELIITDNGREFDDKDFKVACKELGINIGKNPTKKPHLKASVERYFGTVNKKLLKDIPGKTFSNLFEREDYDPEKNAVISQSKLQLLVHKWIIDIYHREPNARNTNLPNLMWQEAVAKFPPQKYSKAPSYLDFNLGRTFFPTLNKNGFVKDYVRYSNEALAAYRAEVGNVKLKAKINTNDIGRVYVLNEKTKQYFEVTAADMEYADSVSIWQHKIHRNYAKSRISQNCSLKEIIQAKREINEIIQECFGSVKKGKTPKSTVTDRSRVARYKEHGLHNEHIKKKPPEPQRNPPGKTELPDVVLPEPDSNGWKVRWSAEN